MSLPYQYRRPVKSSAVVQVGRQLGRATRGVTKVVTYPYRAVVSWHRRRKNSKNLVSGWSVDFNTADLRGPDPREGARFEAAEESANQGLNALARALADPDPALRSQALEVICQFSAERAVRLLIGVLHDPDPKVRAAAAETAGRLGASGAVLSLIFALDDSDIEVRLAAAGAIEQITDMPVNVENDEPAVRERKIQELKDWWRDQRFSELTTRAHEKASNGS